MLQASIQNQARREARANILASVGSAEHGEAKRAVSPVRMQSTAKMRMISWKEMLAAGFTEKEILECVAEDIKEGRLKEVSTDPKTGRTIYEMTPKWYEYYKEESTK